ncbi:immunoglobulin-like domain-containing protein [Pseudomonas auratipiscis]|uniref:immunoglobulin-like domain-containing protein n=1 Tax=Pseudomonas auratipiscis TaxID=3115853 RepID=UPI0038B5A578
MRGDRATGDTVGALLANGQHITIPVGQSTGTVEYTAPDNVHTTNPDLTNSITGTTGGNYEKLESPFQWVKAPVRWSLLRRTTSIPPTRT